MSIFCELDCRAANLRDAGLLIRGALDKYKIVKACLAPLADPEEDLLALAAPIGSLAPMEENLGTGNKTGDIWTDIKYEPEIQNSYRHSNTAQPLHTDGSYERNAPNVSFLYCIREADVGGATTFLDSELLISLLERYANQLLQRLSTTPVYFGKGSDGKERCVIGGDPKGPILTWNFFRAMRCSDPALIQDFHSFLETLVVPSGLLLPILLKQGEAVFFQDERLLHGRHSFFGNRQLKKGGVHCPIV